ncbi:MAG: hypothetical protein JXR76_13045 [Deltaproteobacteria bacterium]|nr:hypothetical protein [Deltaproteobacteria bacterium]
MTIIACIATLLTMSAIAGAMTPNWCYEGEGYNCETCGARTAAYALECKTGEGYCGAIRPTCAGSSEFFLGDIYWSDYFSEEEGQEFCAPGYVVYGLDCDGNRDRCDNVALKCIELIDAVQDESKCHWTSWISEEPTPIPSNNYAGNYVECGSTEYIHGVECAGGWCDNMRLYCCEY